MSKDCHSPGSAPKCFKSSGRDEATGLRIFSTSVTSEVTALKESSWKTLIAEVESNLTSSVGLDQLDTFMSEGGRDTDLP